MVNMGMGEHHRVHLAGVDGQVLVDVGIPALLHAAVNQHMLAPDGHQKAAAGDLARRA